MSSSNLDSANLNLWRESLDATISTFFGVIMSIMHVFVLVRMLTPEEVGMFFFSYAFVYLFVQITRGYGKAIRKKSAEYNSSRSRYLWSGITIIIPTLLIIFCLLFLFRPIANSYSSLYLSYYNILSIFAAVIGFSILELGKYYLAGCNEPALAEKIYAFPCKISLVIFTFIFLSIHPTINAALLAVAFVFSISGFIILFISPHQFTRPDKETIKDIIEFSKWSLPTSLLNDFYHRWDTILLGFMVGSLSLSYYDTSVRIAFLSAVIAVGLSKSANVKISGLHTVGEDILPVAKKLIIVSTFLVIPFLLITIFNGEYILSIVYGKDYKAAKWYLVGITVAQLFQCYRMQFESIFNGVNQPKQTTKTSFISVIVNVITAPFLVIIFGGLGVIYSTILAEIIRIIMYEYQINILFNEIIAPKGVFTQFGIFGILLILLSIIYTLFNLSSLSFLLISSSISIFGFYILQYILSSETREIVYEYKNGQ